VILLASAPQEIGQPAAHSETAAEGKAFLEAVADLVGSALDEQGTAGAGRSDALAIRQRRGPVQITFRSKGKQIATCWQKGGDWADNIIRGIGRLRKTTPAASIQNIDTIELCLTYSYRRIDTEKDKHLLTNAHRGIHGLEVRYGRKIIRYSPSEMIARNVSFARIVKRASQKYSVVGNGSSSSLAQFRIFAARQILVTCRPKPKAVEMHRGNTPVARKDVDQKNVHELADLMGNWLIRQVHEDGRMTYKYWPSPGKEASSNNMIRQFMATVCLERLARFWKEEGLFQLAERNLEYNLSHFYHPEGDLGLIEYNKKAKLGDAAMAALAIAECRNPETLSGTSDRLLKLIDTLHQTNGSFRTFYRPKERNDNQNFYSGEALLLWATLYDRTQGPELLAKIMLSFNYYRRWHLDNRNPAFVPWHTHRRISSFGSIQETSVCVISYLK
jgi:hypothetical protein